MGRKPAFKGSEFSVSLYAQTGTITALQAWSPNIILINLKLSNLLVI